MVISVIGVLAIFSADGSFIPFFSFAGHVLKCFCLEKKIVEFKMFVHLMGLLHSVKGCLKLSFTG